MEKMNNIRKDRILSCIVGLIILILGSLFILWFMGFTLPLEKGWTNGTHSAFSSSVEASKDVGAFLCEYKPVNITYKDVSFSVKNAFAERVFCLYDEYPDSISFMNECRVQVQFEDWEALRFKGYKSTWIIDTKMHLLLDGTISYRFDEPIPPDTIFCYIRECHPPLDSIGANYYSKTLEWELQWDTIQCFSLVKIKE